MSSNSAYLVRMFSATVTASLIAVLLPLARVSAAQPHVPDDPAALAQCTAEEQRVASARMALENQQRTIGMGEQLREEGTAQALDAQKNAFWSLIRVTLGKISDAVDGRAAAVAGLQRRISADTLRQMGKRDSVFLQLARRQLADAEAQYRSMRNAMNWNKLLKYEMQLDEALDLIKGELASIARVQGQLDSGVKSIIEDEHLADIVSSDTAFSDFAQSFYAMFLQSQKVLQTILPAANAAQLLADSMYNLGNSVAGTSQALRQANQREQDLKAVNALKLEMERAVQALNTCRAGAAKKSAKGGGSSANKLLLTTALAGAGSLAALQLVKPKSCGEAPLDDYYDLCPGGAACSSVKREYGEWCKCNGYTGFDDNAGCY